MLPAAALADALAAAWLGAVPDPADVPPLVPFRASSVPTTWVASVACSYFVPLVTTRNRVGWLSLGRKSAGRGARAAASGLVVGAAAAADASLIAPELEELLLVRLSR